MKFVSASLKIIAIVYVFILAFIILAANKTSTRYLLSFVGSIPYGDKLGHFFLMGILSFLINLILKAKTIGKGKFQYLLGSILVFVAVTIEEFSQIFVSGRTFDLSDLIADGLGIIFFGELARLVYQKFILPQKP